MRLSSWTSPRRDRREHIVFVPEQHAENRVLRDRTPNLGPFLDKNHERRCQKIARISTNYWS
jgi:hypothetical protein